MTKRASLSFSLNMGQTQAYLEGLYTAAMSVSDFEEAARVTRNKAKIEKAVETTAIRYAELITEKIDEAAGMALASGTVFDAPLRHLYAGAGSKVGMEDYRLFKIHVRKVKGASFKLDMRFKVDAEPATSDTTGSDRKIKIDSIGRRRFGAQRHNPWKNRANFIMSTSPNKTVSGTESKSPKGWYVVGADPMPKGINKKVPKVIKVAPRFERNYDLESRTIKDYINRNYRVNGQNLIHALDKAALIGIRDVINASKSKSYRPKNVPQGKVSLTSAATKNLPAVKQNVTESLMVDHLAKVFVKSFSRASIAGINKEVGDEIAEMPDMIDAASRDMSNYLSSSEMDDEDEDGSVSYSDSAMMSAFDVEEGGAGDDDPYYN
jgi:hypothetical protein